MATIGLKVYDPYSSGSSPLADTLAKGVFGDPEAQMKARALAAQVLAHQAYATKLGAETGLVNIKTQEEQALKNAREASGPLVGAALANNLPVPVASVHVPQADYLTPDQGTVVHQNTGDVTTAPPAIVTPQEQNQYDTQRKALQALGVQAVQMGDNPNALIESYGKGLGVGTLAGGLYGGNVTGDQQRIGGGLYTGTAPTTNTVWSGQDTAGVNAAARQAIAEESAKPVYKGEPGQDLGVVQVIQTPQGPKAVPVAGTQGAPRGPYHGDTPVADNNNTIFNMSVKWQNPDAQISPAEAILYSQAYATLFGSTVQIQKDNLGQDQAFRLYKDNPYGAPNPKQVFDRIGLVPPKPSQIVDPATGAPIDPNTGAVISPLPKGPPKPPTQEQSQYQLYAPDIAAAALRLINIPTDAIPGPFIQHMLGTRGNDPTVTQAIMAQMFASPADRTYAQAISEMSQLLYAMSGKAITQGEFVRNLLTFAPQNTDTPEQRANKDLELRRVVAQAVRLGFANDPETAQTVMKNITDSGLDLRGLDIVQPGARIMPEQGGAPAPNAVPKQPAPPGVTEEQWGHMTSKEREAWAPK